jgi:SAM-dependent methyltransferase
MVTNPTQSVAVTAVRDFWNRRPCNVGHSGRPIGTKEYFDEVEARKYFVEPHIPKFAQFDRWRNKRVLEIGCGIGTDTMNFARAGAQVTAMDLSDASLDIARLRAHVYGLSNIRFYRGNAEELTSVVTPEPYDLIYSFGVIHHTPNPERVIQQLRQYSRPGTVLKVMLYHRYSWKALEVLVREGKGAFWKLSKLLQHHSEAQSGCPVTYTYTRLRVAELLAGFHIQSVSVEHIFPYAISHYLRYRYRKIWYFRYLPDAAFHWLEKCLGWHLCVTATFDGDRSGLGGWI